MITLEKGAKRIGPFAVPKAMSSTISANLATNFKIKGNNYSITSACSTSAHCIGHGAELIQLGKQDIVFAGGGEELDWTLSSLFDAMGALSSKYNETPAVASRAYDADRDGFVIAGGGGMLVLEEYEHAKARGAKIYAELTGYGANSDGADMVQPSGEGAVRCMKMALENVKKAVTYINTHGTSTPVGDMKELEALRTVFGEKMHEQVEERLTYLTNGEKPRRNIEVMKEAKAEVDAIAAKKAKMEKKRKSEAAAEEAVPVVEEEVVEEEAPKKKKKSKKD
jgi:3-oxoacyl-[acyl-carrier-protein] synthase-1